MGHAYGIFMAHVDSLRPVGLWHRLPWARPQMTSYTALSIVAPHGQNIVNGRKSLEVRSWKPDRLPLMNLLIVENDRFLVEDGEVDPEGRAVALVDVHEVNVWVPSETEAARSTGWEPGYYAWRLENVRLIVDRPVIPAKRKLYEVEINGLAPRVWGAWFGFSPSCYEGLPRTADRRL